MNDYLATITTPDGEQISIVLTDWTLTAATRRASMGCIMLDGDILTVEEMQS